MKPNLIAEFSRTLNIVLILNLIRARRRELFPSNSGRRWVKTDGCMGGQLPEFAKFTSGRRAGLRRRLRNVGDTTNAGAAGLLRLLQLKCEGADVQIRSARVELASAMEEVLSAGGAVVQDSEGSGF